MTRIIQFFNSNFFISLSTFFVGGLAIVLYFKQKENYKKDAAKLILQEIRYAEQHIRNARVMGAKYYLANKLLPTNSWHKNIHLFTRDLEETEIDLISRFYSHAGYLDRVINIISDYKNKKIRRRAIGQPVMPPQAPSRQSTGPLPPPSAQEHVEPAEQVIIEESLDAVGILEEVSEKVEFLYNTPALDKLKHIAEKR